MSENEENQDFLRRVFGMLDDNVRIYQILEEREVQHDEFQYCQVMFQLVFGDKGFAETLGPTWNMIHDPRFQAIENLMVVERKAIFGGDARLGKQYINDDGSFSSTVSDLEKYAEILGEGRNFHNVLAHPDVKCQKRLWLERIYRGFTNVQPYADFGCTCAKATAFPFGLNLPENFKDAPDDMVWALIKQECPNRTFTKGGTPTAYGKLMFALIRADLIGLIHDYAETPLIDSYVYLRDHGVVTAAESVSVIDPHGQEAPRVLQEIDILEQALTHRATLRVTAYKLLKQMSFERELQEHVGKDFQMTDTERDRMLQMIYESDYPMEKTEADPEGKMHRYRVYTWQQQLKTGLLDYAVEVAKNSYEFRQADQLSLGRTQAQRTVAGLLSGTILPINAYTEPTAEIPENQAETEVMKYAAMLEAIMSNEFKQELYLRMVQAEQEQDTAVMDILTPVFLTPGYELDETGFYNILEAIRIGSRSLRVGRLEAIRGVRQGDTILDAKDMKEVEGEFHSKDNPGGMLR